MRELEAGTGPEDADRAAWSGLLGGAEGSVADLSRRLCTAIRAGDLDTDFDRTLDIVLARTTAAARLVRPDKVPPHDAPLAIRLRPPAASWRIADMISIDQHTTTGDAFARAAHCPTRNAPSSLRPPARIAAIIATATRSTLASATRRSGELCEKIYYRREGYRPRPPRRRCCSKIGPSISCTSWRSTRSASPACRSIPTIAPARSPTCSNIPKPISRS